MWPLSSVQPMCSNAGMNDDLVPDLQRQLAEALAHSALLGRQLERMGYQLDRMQDQLERALRELEALRRAANKPHTEDPPPKPGAALPKPTDTATSSAGPPPASAGSGSASPGPWSPKIKQRKPPKARSSFARNPIPAGLERVLDAHKPDDCCVCSGERLVELRFEDVEVYHFLPARLVVRVVRRSVCRCKKCQHIATAPLPEDLVPRMQATSTLIAQIIYEKFGRHLPLHRIDAELKRMGGDIREVTRDRWLKWAALQLGRLMPSLMLELFVEGLLHTDGTGLAVIRNGIGTQLGQMAVFCNDHAVVYQFTSTKHGKHQRRFLGLEDAKGEATKLDAPGRFRGYQVADAASIADRTYSAGGVVECGCNAHARCMFADAELNHRRLASEGVAFWTGLYKVEKEAKNLDPAARLALRTEKSAPIVADFKAWLAKHHGTLPPQEPISKALNYLHNHWDALMRFLLDGRIPIDNNRAERALRAVAVGRKNYLFAGSNKAAERSAMFYTFVETCRLHKVDPPTWLADVLPRIAVTRPSDYATLLPAQWAAAKQAKSAA